MNTARTFAISATGKHTRKGLNLHFRPAPAGQSRRPLLGLAILLCSLGLAGFASSARAANWPAAVTAALDKAGTNRQEIVKALEQAPEEQRDGMQFLVANMPPPDLQSLSAAFLLENASRAYQAFEDAPWARTVPNEVFLNDVLPYASLDEDRDNWRKRLHDIALPLIKDAKTSGQAAQAINAKMFGLLKVKYSTKRRVPDQGPFETMQTGVATCTGLSILLVDACRSVGVPARIAGTPLWSNNSGNHTWVEVWDAGGWHYTGAAEQDPNGLDRGWFGGNASQAVRDNRLHAIYATTWRHTGIGFPMSWLHDEEGYVNAINVTDRYTTKPKTFDAALLQLNIKVLDRPVGERVPAKVTVTDIANGTIRFTGMSKADTADINDHLYFDVRKQRTYLVEAERDGQTRKQYYTAGTNKEEVLTIFLGGIPPLPVFSPPVYVSPAVTKPLSAKEEAKLKESITGFFTASAADQAGWKFSSSLEKLLRRNEPAVRKAAWEAFRDAPVHAELKQDFDAHKVRFETHVSPYTVKTVGTRPANGWALFIAMHGGGGAPQELNDSQWRHMQIYYRDHPEAGGYIYVALRAPDNSWNGFYTGYAYPLIENLLRQFLLFGDVDPNKEFIMGYSHGGYGAFAIGPKMPDHFAAIHSSAAAIADGAVPDTLRNTFFSSMVGGKDTMYGRYDRIREFQAAIQKLRGDRNDIYPVTVQIIPDHPHSGLPDRDKIADMYDKVRNPVPRELVWKLTDGVIHDFFWLHVPAPGGGEELDAACRDNHLTVTTKNLAAGSLLLDSRLVDFKKPVTLDFNGQTTTRKLEPSLRTLCETLQRRGDPELAFTAELPLPATKQTATR